MTQEEKQQAIDILKKRVAEQAAQLAGIDDRLLEYYQDLCEHSGTTLGDENDWHNGMELLCGIRLLRLLRTYVVDLDKVREVIYDGEGEWEKSEDGFWQHVRGGLGQPGRQGKEVYRWEPFQVFMLVAIYGLKAWIPTGNFEGERRVAATERVDSESKEIMDLRRLCTRFILFGPRKINKSGFSAFCNVEDFMKGDYDAQIVCTANSQDQSKILFGKTKDFLLQLDPVSGRRTNGKYLSYTATEVKFQKGKFRAAELQAIPAGGKLPDGKFASLSAEDEYGSAEYVNGSSDMGKTAAVIESSMGPRREPLTIITTTASLIRSGPFIEMLEATRLLLLKELKYESGECEPLLAEDRQMCLLLEPDEWERDKEEYLLTSKVLRKKINPMLGKIAQHAFYDSACVNSRQDDQTRRETLAKLFNVYQSSKRIKWITPEEIRSLQVPRKIDDCTADKGWVVFCGLDFSQGDDLHTAGFLAARQHPSGSGTEFFADCDAWIKEETLNSISIRPLYEEWIAKGWLRLSEGKVFRPSLFIQRLDELIEKGVQIAFFGYDSYQSADPINTLKAYLNEKFGIANPEQYIMSVSQTNATYNPAVDMLTGCVKDDDPNIHFSLSPLWPYCFGCAVLDSDTRYENKKPVKQSPGSDACKVDPVQTLCTGFILFEKFEATPKGSSR